VKPKNAASSARMKKKTAQPNMLRKRTAGLGVPD